MSLTSILKDKNRTNLKNWMKFHFPNKGFGKGDKPNIIVAPKRSGSSYSGDVGTVFDYLVRFNLERLNKDCTNKRDGWVAQRGYKAILDDLSGQEEITIGYHQDRQINVGEFKMFLKQAFQAAQDNYYRFLKNGLFTRGLVESTCFLNKLDIRVRVGIIDAKIDQVDDTMIDDLLMLISIVNWNLFKAKNSCFLNPTFGKGSKLVGGADADLIIDDLLIDIKTNQSLKLERSDLSQLIGYYLLSLYNANNGGKDLEIKRIGIYFARFNCLWIISLNEYFLEEEFQKRLSEFEMLIKDTELEMVDDQSNNGLPQTIVDYEIDPDDFKCPYCESNVFIKAGRSKSGKFRYKCSSCKKSFSSIIETSATKEVLKNIKW